MRTLVHPLGLGILLISGVAALAVMRLASWSGRTPWVIGWGLAAYAAVVALLLIRERIASRPLSSSRDPGEDGTGLPDGPDRAEAAEHSFFAAASRDNIVALTQEALRRLNNPAALGACALGPRIPRLLSSFSGQQGSPSEITPLQRARVLREVLMACIERLKDAGGTGPTEAAGVRYLILHDEYVVGRPNHQIMTRHSISESTFHRYRREAIRAVASELARQEELLSAEQAASQPSQ